jgi:putative membrane protein
MKTPLLMGLIFGALPLAAALAAAPSPHDVGFARQAMLGNMAEIAEGQMAVTKATSQDVKQFGQHMIDDHTTNNQELQTLAQQKGIKLPTQLDQKHANEGALLNKQSGAAFDRAYIKAQVAGHEQMLGVMRTEIATGRDADLKAFAQKTAQVVQGHLQMAQQIEGKMPQ